MDAYDWIIILAVEALRDLIYNLSPGLPLNARARAAKRKGAAALASVQGDA